MCPPPFMANAILNFHFDFPHTSLSLKPEISFGGIRPKSASSSMRATSRTKGVRLTLAYVLAFLRCHLSAEHGRAPLQDAFLGAILVPFPI